MGVHTDHEEQLVLVHEKVVHGLVVHEMVVHGLVVHEKVVHEKVAHMSLMVVHTGVMEEELRIGLMGDHMSSLGVEWEPVDHSSDAACLEACLEACRKYATGNEAWVVHNYSKGVVDHIVYVERHN